MVFKQKDSEESRVRALELRVKQSSDAKERARFEKELRIVRAGAQGEHDTAYLIDFELKDSKNWAVIHDLRIGVNGRIAQIDHLLINRLLEIYVIESKFPDESPLREWRMGTAEFQSLAGNCFAGGAE